MDPSDEFWATIRRMLPDAEDMALAVAAELGEPLEDVRPSVLIGMIALNGRLGPEAAVASAIAAELGRLESHDGSRPSQRAVAADSLDGLLARTRALDAKGSLDLETIVAVQRASGAIAARTDRPAVVMLHRYAVTRRLIWEHCVAAMDAGRLDADVLAGFGRFLLLWNELTSLAVTDGYRMAERDILARAVEARRGALEELLGVVADDSASAARLRRIAVHHGLDPDGTYWLIAIAPRLERDPSLVGRGIGDEELEALARRIGHLVGVMSPGAESAGAGIRLPVVMATRGRIAVLAREDWVGRSRVPTVLDRVLGARAGGASPRRGSGDGAAIESGRSAWVAIGSGPIHGVRALAERYADLVDATRTAERLSLRGWIPDADDLALERLLVADGSFADATVRRELGPVLADQRWGEDLIETLQAYFDAGENVTAAARRLHLATRTVGYRLARIESLLGRPIDGERGRRLSTALIVHRLRRGD